MQIRILKVELAIARLGRSPLHPSLSLPTLPQMSH